MKIYRAKHDNVPESPVRTLYGRKGNLLLLPLDVCILQMVNGREEFRPSPEDTRLIAAPIQEAGGGRIGLIAQYDWPPINGKSACPIVTAQLAPSANIKGIEDLRVLATQIEVGDTIICSPVDAEGAVTRAIDWCHYPDLTHQVEGYRVVFHQHIGREAHGSAVHLKTGELIGILIATRNQQSDDGPLCRALVFPA